MKSIRIPSALRAVGAFAFSIVVAGSAMLGTPTSIRAAAANGIDAWDLMSGFSTVAAPFRPLLDALTDDEDQLAYGTDGRWTVLLLGSDTRSGGIGRTDTIMIASLSGNSINVASIPRDTLRIPNPFTSDPSDTFRQRVNAIAKSFVTSSCSVACALLKFEIVIEKLLDVEIDNYALVNFRSFEALVDVIDPITINNTQNIRDPYFWDDPNKKSGVWFPIDSTYTLRADIGGPLCNGLWRNYTSPPTYLACHRALPYVRSRKGPGNSDYQRARRQQKFVGTVISQVYSSDVTPLKNSGSGLQNLKKLYTNIPFASQPTTIYNALNYASLKNTVVFSPTYYASGVPGTSAIQLNLDRVREWTAANMK